MALPAAAIPAIILAAGTLGSAGIGAGVSKKKNKLAKELSEKEKFKAEGGVEGNHYGGPNSIGAILSTIGKAAVQVGKFAAENPEVVEAAIKLPGQIKRAVNGADMIGHNPILKHMGGRGANMIGNKPMMMGKKKK
jgi:hypothetical protein